MKVRDLGWFSSKLYANWRQGAFDERIERFGVERNARFGNLSKGQKKQVSLALALAASPELLVLDDPAAGLDPVARRALLEQLLQSTREAGSTVLFSSHQLDDVERVADHAAILHYSQLRAQGSLEDLAASVRQYKVTFAPGRAPRELPPMAGLVSSRRVGDTLLLTFAGGATMPRIADGDVVDERPVGFTDAALASLGRVDQKEQPRGDAAAEPVAAGAGAPAGGF
jgi:ABC-2 type transport system ATP-binding protein